MRALLYNLVSVTKSCIKYNNINQVFYVNARNFSAISHDYNGATEAEAVVSVASNVQKSKQGAAHEELQRSLHIAVIGVPNAGKSTFINNIINHRVCPTSSKVHTTRKSNQAVHTTGNAQLVFYDTPGLVTQHEMKKHNLDQSFKSSYRHAIQHADIIAVLQDVSNVWTRQELHSTVIDTLNAYPNLPSLLILNKIDALKSKRVLLDLIKTLTNNSLSSERSQKQLRHRTNFKQSTNDVAKTNCSKTPNRQTSWSNFQEVFLVSSITGSGLNDMHNYLISVTKERPWQYSSETFTDASPESLIVESVRARLLDYLPQEIPYNLKSEIEYYSLENDTIYASVRVICPTVRIERLICGESNGRLRQISERVTSDLVETFGMPISLTIATISKTK